MGKEETLSRHRQNYLYWSADARFQCVARKIQIINLSLSQKHFIKRTQEFNVAIKALALLSLGQAFQKRQPVHSPQAQAMECVLGETSDNNIYSVLLELYQR